MNSLHNTRRKFGLTQKRLSELTGINQPYLSRLENGWNCPTKQIKIRIEKVIGHVDYIESERFKLKDSNWYQAEKLLKKLIEKTVLMEADERMKFNVMVRKYFN